MAKGGGSRGELGPRALRGPAASPVGQWGLARKGRGREHAPCALLGCLLRVRAAGAAAGWLAGWREGGREGGWERSALGFASLLSTSAASLRTLGGDSENTHVWACPGANCRSGFCLLAKGPAIGLELFSTLLLIALIECELRGPAHWTQKPQRAAAPFFPSKNDKSK